MQLLVVINELLGLEVVVVVFQVFTVLALLGFVSVDYKLDVDEVVEDEARSLFIPF